MIDVDVLSDNPAQVLCDLLLDIAASHDEPLRGAIAGVRASLGEPIRIAVVGRVSSGKSTLVNALVGRRVAATSAQDCTRYPVVYRSGAPESAVAVSADGRRIPLSIESALGGGQVVPGQTIVRLEMTFQSAVLRNVTLIDTPGLAATSPNALVIDTSRQLAASAEILLYLFRGTARSDDAGVVEELRLTTAEPGGRGLVSTIGLLSHADNHGSGGWGADDPIELARASAARTARQLPEHFSQVLPVSGLMAESARTGRVTEADSRMLRRLREFSPELLRFGASIGVSDLDPAAFAHVCGVLTPFGVNHGRAHATTSAELGEWMREVSGVRALELATRDAAVRVRHARTARAVEQLGAITRRADVPAELGRQVEAFEHSAPAHVIREIRAERLLARHQPNSPLLVDLRRLLSRVTIRERLADVPDGNEPGDWVLARASQYQAASGLAPTGAEAEAARTLAQSMLHIGWAARGA